MTWFYNCSALVDVNGQKGPGDMKLKMILSLREIGETSNRAPAPPAAVKEKKGRVVRSAHNSVRYLIVSHLLTQNAMEVRSC
jgi:hypothetical protein